MIKHTVKSTSFVDYEDLERLIQDTYGFAEFSIPCNEECGNCTSITGTASPNDLSDYDREEIENKKQMYNTRIYINDLAGKGLFPLGSYSIEVSW